MIRIFWQSLFTLFLGFFVIVNVAMAFNLMSQLFTNPQLAYIDYSDKYLSFHNLLDFLTNQRLEDSNFIAGFQGFLGRMNDFIVQRFNGSIWNRLDFEWWEYLLNIASYLLLPIVIFVNFVMYFVYLFAIALWVVIQFLRFMSGGFYTTMPQDTYPDMAIIFNNSLTLFV